MEALSRSFTKLSLRVRNPFEINLAGISSHPISKSKGFIFNMV
jgi:hypothetical protein